MNFLILKDLNQFQQYENQWRSVQINQNIHCPFAGYDWITEYCRYLLTDKELFISINFQQNKFIMLPFYVENKKTGVISLIGNKFFDYRDALAGLSDIPGVIDFLLNTKAHTVRLPNLREDAFLFSLAKFNKNNKFHVLERDLFNSPYLRIEGKTWEEYYNNLSRNSKDVMKRKIKKLSFLGQVSFGYCKERSELKEVINTMYAQHIKRRKLLGQNRSLFLYSKNKDFINALCERLFLDSKLYMFYLKLNEKIIASALCFLENSALYYYIPTFDCDYKSCSPGRILLYHIIKFSFDNGFKEFDFMIGEEDYKLHWNTQARKIKEVILFRRNFKGGLSLFASRISFAWKGILGFLSKTKLRTVKRAAFKIFYKAGRT